MSESKKLIEALEGSFDTIKHKNSIILSELYSSLENHVNLLNKMAKWRVYFVRHGISKTWQWMTSQWDNVQLALTGAKQIISSSRKLIDMRLNKDNTIIIYSWDTTRVNESTHILCKKIF